MHRVSRQKDNVVAGHTRYPGASDANCYTPDNADCTGSSHKGGGNLNIQTQRNNVARGYHCPGCADLPAKRNVYNFGSGGDDHERAIFELCLKAKHNGHHFITQAQDRLSGEIADFIDLDTGERFEVETDPKRAARFAGRIEIQVVKLW